MQRLFVLALIFFLMSCLGRKDKIVVPELKEDFYQQALLRIDNELEGDENNLQLVGQKIYYCERLDWPSTCIQALDEQNRQKGMTPQLLDQYIAYCLNHELYPELLSIVGQWDSWFEPQPSFVKAKILALTNLDHKREAGYLLKDYLANKTNKEDIEFGASQFLYLEDTLFSTYYLSKLYQVDPRHPLIYDHYADILFKLGHTNKALNILEEHALNNPTDCDFHLKLSSIYAGLGSWELARNILKPFTKYDTVVYSISSLFSKEGKWDSAHLYIDQIIDRDSLNKKAWWAKAQMYEDQGWLSYSLNYFDHVVYLDPHDSVAKERGTRVRRKIAYLRRLKFEREEIPVLSVEPEKSENNNE